ncbi:zf-HC2 domain-containing protein [Nonomuraea longicatena]
MTCEEVRLSLGAHALGALDPEEALEVDTHLATCEACGGELEELAGVAAFLGKVAEPDVVVVERPPRGVLDRLLADRARRRRRGRLWLAVAASVAVLGTGGAVWSAVQSGGGTSVQTASAPAADAAPEAGTEAGPDAASAKAENSGEDSAAVAPRAEDVPQTMNSPLDAGPSALDRTAKGGAGEAFVGQAGRVSVTMTATPAGKGSEVAVSVAGVPEGRTLTLVVLGPGGRKEQAATWVVGPEQYTAAGEAKHAVRLPVKEISGFEVLDAEGTVVVRSKSR